MKITTNIREFIAKKVEAKIAPVSITQDYEAVVTIAEKFGKDLTSRIQAVVKKEFEDFLALHPELANSSLYDPTCGYHGGYCVQHGNSEIAKQYKEQIQLRTEYVDEVIQRVCIDAHSCKNTEELLALIDRIVR